MVSNFFTIMKLQNQWKRINHKQNAGWQHLSQLKVSAFCSLQKNCQLYEMQQLILGISLPSSGWWSPISYCKKWKVLGAWKQNKNSEEKHWMKEQWCQTFLQLWNCKTRRIPQRINHEQSAGWQHLSQLKASAFCSLQKNCQLYETQQLVLGISSPSSRWWSQPY